MATKRRLIRRKDEESVVVLLFMICSLQHLPKSSINCRQMEGMHGAITAKVGALTLGAGDLVLVRKRDLITVPLALCFLALDVARPDCGARRLNKQHRTWRRHLRANAGALDHSADGGRHWAHSTRSTTSSHDTRAHHSRARGHHSRARRHHARARRHHSRSRGHSRARRHHARSRGHSRARRHHARARRHLTGIGALARIGALAGIGSLTRIGTLTGIHC